MSVTRNVFDRVLQENCLMSDSSVEIFQFGDKIEIYISNRNETTILVYNCDLPFNLVASGTVVHNTKVLKIVQSCSRILMLDDSSDLYELVNDNLDTGFCFGSDGSSSQGVKKWRLTARLEHTVVTMTDITNGICVIRKQCQDKCFYTYLEVYRYMNDEWFKEWAKVVSNYEDKKERCLLVSVKNRGERAMTCRKSFMDVHKTCTDLVLAKADTGNVYVVAIYEDKSRIAEKEFMRKPGLTQILIPSNGAVVLVYGEGTVIMFHYKRTSTYKCFLLPYPVTSMACCIAGGLWCMWTDGSDLHLARLMKGRLLPLKVEHNIKGVRHLLLIEDFFLAVTVQGELYKVGTNGPSEAAEEAAPLDRCLEAIHQEGLEWERLGQDVEGRLAMYRAMAAASEPLECFNVRVDAHSVIIQNNSNSTYDKSLWRVRIEVPLVHGCKVRLMNLETDLFPGSSAYFTLDMSMATTYVETTLVSNMRGDLEVLFLRLPRVFINSSHQIHDGHSTLTTQLRQLRKTRRF